MHLTLALFNNLMGMDGLIILVLGLLFFGRRLPEVGKNIALTVREFGSSEPDAEMVAKVVVVVIVLIIVVYLAYRSQGV